MSYSTERDEIRSAFEDGMDLLFKTMFTESVLLYPLDQNNTLTNVYQETDRKVYLSPYSLTAKVVISREQGENEVQTIQQTVSITVPNKQLNDLGIPHETDEDLDTLQKCAVKYKGYLFLVDKVVPRTHVADTFLFYEFQCTTRDKDKTEYVLPEIPEEPEEPEEPGGNEVGDTIEP